MDTHVAPHKAGFVFVLSVFVVALLLGQPLAPLEWGSNEINYYDLAYRYVSPDEFGADHSVFDRSNSRAVSFTLIGSTISWLGFDGAKTVFGFAYWLGYAVAIAFVARRLGLGVASLAAALFVYFLFGQSLFGGEWLFNRVEAKVFAYAAVLVGIGQALSRRWWWAIGCMALATYFHFLVGLYWAAALLLLHGLSHNGMGRFVKLSVAYVVFVLPILITLVYERVGVQVDTSALDLSLAQIYAEFRNPHHVAPFARGMPSFILSWLPGVLQHLILAMLFWVIHKRGQTVESAPGIALFPWAIALNLYMVLAVFVSFIDRNTYAAAPLYLFRPSAMILFLSCLLLMRFIWQEMALLRSVWGSVAVLGVIATLVLPGFAQTMRSLLTIDLSDRFSHYQTAPQRDLVDWIKNNTQPADPILLEPTRPPWSLAEGIPSIAAYERLTGRPFIVNYKFVPVAKPDTVEWYKRLQLRQAFFDGDCAALGGLRAEYVIFLRKLTPEPLPACVTPVYENAEYLVTKRSS